jgi:hypothetical protein
LAEGERVVRIEILHKLIKEVYEELILDEEGKKDACYRKVKSRYKVWPSAYASGALVKCRKVGAKNWGNSKKEGLYEEESDISPDKLEQILKDEGGASGLEPFMKAYPNASEEDIVMTLAKMPNVARHEDGDYILDDDKDVDIQEKKQASSEKNLGDWFKRKGEKGSKGGWVDCKAPDGDGGYKECAQGDRKEKPYCRPTPSACKKEPQKRETLTYEGDDSILEHFKGATLEEGGLVCEGCLFEMLQEASCGCPDLVGEAEYQGRKVTLNKPTRGDVKKFKVYVKDPKTGNIKKVNFGHGGSSAKAKGEKTMKIRKNNPKARKSFRARHNCDNPGPKTKARYWSCKKW